MPVLAGPRHQVIPEPSGPGVSAQTGSTVLSKPLHSSLRPVSLGSHPSQSLSLKSGCLGVAVSLRKPVILLKTSDSISFLPVCTHGHTREQTGSALKGGSKLGGLGAEPCSHLEAQLERKGSRGGLLTPQANWSTESIYPGRKCRSCWKSPKTLETSSQRILGTAGIQDVGWNNTYGTG